MRRIVFITESELNKVDVDNFTAQMKDCGISVSRAKYDESYSDDYDTLTITDDATFFAKLKKKNIEPLVAIDNISSMDLFPKARYFVMDFCEADPDYFIKIWQRIRNLPWEMISTKRLMLRETIESDVDEFVKMYKDPEMTMYNEPLYEDVDAEKSYVKEYREKVYAVSGFGVWTVIRKEDGAIIGRAGLSVRSGFDGVELGFAIGTKYQGNGYAKECINAIDEFAAKNELGQVYALVMPDNKKSVNLLTGLGFATKENRTIDNTEYSIYTQFVNNLACS